jgi:hypothetical protein
MMGGLRRDKVTVGLLPAVTAVLVLFFCGLPWAACAGEDDLEETTMMVGEQRLTLVKYHGEYFNKVPLSSLEKPQWKNRQVCVEGKFDQVQGVLENDHILRIWGSEINFLYPKEKGMPGLIRGDNIWVGGFAEGEPGKEALRVRVSGIAKLPNDMELFKQRFAAYSKKGEWRELITLGDWVGTVGKLAPSLSDQDAYRRKQRQAYRKALEVWADQLAVDDAEGQYLIAVKYIDLLDDSISTQRHLLKCLKIDPTHRAAQEKLQRYGYVQYENEWMTVAEMERRLKKTPPPETITEPGTETGKTPVVDVGVPGTTGSERLTPAALAVEKNRIRQEALAGTKPEIDVLVETAGKVKDPELALYLMRQLALKPEERALDGIATLRTLGQEEVAKTSLEILVWRPDKRAYEDFVASLAKEVNANVLRYGLSLLAQAEPRRSYPGLIKLLDSENAGTRDEVQQSLRKLTGERFEKVPEWRAWWENRKDTYH